MTASKFLFPCPVPVSPGVFAGASRIEGVKSVEAVQDPVRGSCLLVSTTRSMGPAEYEGSILRAIGRLPEVAASHADFTAIAA